MKKLAFIVLLLIPIFTFPQQSSVLSNGDWYKIAINETGVYRISYNDLETFGIDVTATDPKKISIYGNPQGMLPESLDEPYYTDLQPIAIKVIGEDDGSFDPDDQILFYGQSPDVWDFDYETGNFNFIKNIYSLKSFYFLTIGNGDGLRVQVEQDSHLDDTFIAEYYNKPVHHELDLVNPTKFGRNWLGESFEDADSISIQLNTENTLFTNENKFRISLAANCTEESHFVVKINGEYYTTITAIKIQDNYMHYRLVVFDSLCAAGDNTTEVTIIYDRPNDSAQAWIDYIDMELMGLTALVEDQLSFRTDESIAPGEITYFSLWSENPESIVVWNVTDPMNVMEEELFTSSSHVWYKLPTESLLEFHANNGNSYYSVEFIEQIENQNLHGLTPPDFLIITHPDFTDHANQLADLHRNKDNLSVETVTVDDIYNEFSSGAQDITAIRNFVRYLSEKSQDSKPDYLLLFGDASYDYINRVENNTNFVPTFESDNSFNWVSSYATDQYFGMIDPVVSNELQLAVGRIPVSNTEEAGSVINKIQSYYSSQTLGNWVNEMLFIGDNGDGNRHVSDAELITEIVATDSPVMNISKCYLDFFEIIQTNNGPRIPEANQMITSKTNDGVLYVNYTGHGGTEAMSQEKVVTADDILNWTNTNQLPLWVIASSEVALYDNPEITSLGESLLLAEKKGAIALISTTRPAFAGANFAFNKAIIEKLTNNILENELRFGDLFIHSTLSNNDLKWALLGDPALKIHIPQFNVLTTSINGINVDEFTDTISPGELLKIRGQITDKIEGSLQSGFTGILYLKIFAPPYIRQTLGTQVMDIEIQDSVLVEGISSVVNGEFEIQVSLPPLYQQDYGNLKLSWYAENGETDANGYNNRLIYGGEPDAIAEENELLDFVKVYPTAFSENINIEMPVSINKSIVYRVYDTYGKTVYTQKSVTQKKLEIINMSGLAKGMYILNIEVDNLWKNFKVFKQ